MLCGCGKPGRYFIMKDGDIESVACNKYGRCGTYEELREELLKVKGELVNVKLAISNISPWLAASLTEETCKEYRDACKAIFEIDR